MVYVVERYLPGVSRVELERQLERLAELTRGTPVEYMGSTIVIEDEACFCQFEAPSEEAVAEANRRAGMPFDRIVAAVAVPGATRREGRESFVWCDDRAISDRGARCGVTRRAPPPR